MLKTVLAAAAAVSLSLAASVRAAAADVADTSAWARFSGFTYAGKSNTPDATPGADRYLNPVIAGFHPDPSVCRVGDDYYLVNSSFNYFPGIPIWHSTDLVHWTQIGNVIDRPAQYAMHGGQMSAGTYAPTLRYHDGTFYLVCTFVGGIGNFYVTAADPKGPWSDPVKLPNVGGIDPSFFFDDDGRCYVTSCDAPAKALYNGHRVIRLWELDLAQKKTVGGPAVLIDGGTDLAKHPIWCEGPHLYKVGKTYYAMCAQGGTGTAHTEVIFRSDALRGPYVPWDHNPILTQMNLPGSRPDPVTCTGHADLVQTQNNDWYAVFLGCQPYDRNYFNTGRETFLLPVTWTADGWPVILPPRTPVPLTPKSPNLPADQLPGIPTTGDVRFSDNFDRAALGFRWVGIRGPVSQWHAIDPAAHTLLLQPRPDRLSGQGNPTYLGIRQLNNDFSCTVTLTARPATADCVAGLAAFQNESHYYAIDVGIVGGHLADISVEQPSAHRGSAGGRGAHGGTTGPVNGAPAPAAAASQPAQKLPDNLTSIILKIEGAGPITRCYYKVPGGEFVQVGRDLPSSYLSTDVAGGFQGVTLGMSARR